MSKLSCTGMAAGRAGARSCAWELPIALSGTTVSVCAQALHQNSHTGFMSL